MLAALLLAVALLLVGQSEAQTSVNLNVVSKDGISFLAQNVSTNDARFTFRQTSLTAIPLTNVVMHLSLDVAAEVSDGSASGSVDGIVGFWNAPMTALSSNAPAAFMAYFTADAQVNFNNLDIQGNLEASASLVGKVFTKLEEVTPAGAVVNTVLLKNRSWSRGSVQSSGPNGELKYITFSSSSSSFTIRITYAVSSILGKLSVGGATITPRNTESFFEVEGYPYGNPNNHLRLTLFLGHLAARASKTFTATQTVIAGSGNEQIYFHLDKTAVVDGESLEVTVTGLATANIQPSDIDNNIFSGKLTASGDLKAEVRQVSVDFPAGGVLISYDPAMGFGAPDSAALLVPSFAVLLFSLALFFFTL